MPGLDGVAVLAGARQRRPGTVRLLLTGHADLDSAVAAVNDGNIFRFLVKPCASAVLRRALSDAIGLHRSLTAERELLEQTLRGAVAALADALALANPTAFARATRIHALVRRLVAALDPPDAWRIEVAAMLSQIGTVVLAPGTVAKLHDGRPLNEDERAQVQDLPASPSASSRRSPASRTCDGSSATSTSLSSATATGRTDRNPPRSAPACCGSPQTSTPSKPAA